MSACVEESQMMNASFVYKPQNILARNGQSDKFFACIARGAGVLSYTWLKDGNNISDTNIHYQLAANGIVLYLTEVDDHAEGVYTCVVESDTAEVINSSATVGVMGESHVTGIFVVDISFCFMKLSLNIQV